MSQSQDPKKTPDEDDEDEFQDLLGTLNTKLEGRVGTAQAIQKARKECKDNPDLAATRAYLADLEAKRVTPQYHPAWAKEIN